ncbi:MAG: hypothetical protein MRY32_04630 [Rickettsiales bacterium]|nr:hypothetical protein [Rickettsiales bacterium]
MALPPEEREKLGLPEANVNGASLAGVAVAQREEADQSMLPGRAGKMMAEGQKAIQNFDPKELMTTDFLLEVAEGGVPIPGVQMVGNVAGAGVGFIVADRRAKKQYDAMIERYRDEISTQLGVPSEQVGIKELLEAAKHSPGLRKSLESIDAEKESHPYVNISGLLGMGGAVMASAPLFAGGPIIGLVGGAVAAMGGYMAGSKIGESFLSPNEDANPQKHLEEIEMKLQAGEPVTELDLFKLRVAQSPYLEQQIESQMGKHFAQLNKADQKFVMRRNASLRHRCMVDADRCNNGLNTDELMFDQQQHSPVQEINDLAELTGDAQMSEQVGDEPGVFGKHTARHQSGSGKGGNFREMVKARRVLASQGAALDKTS